MTYMENIGLWHEAYRYRPLHRQLAWEDFELAFWFETVEVSITPYTTPIEET